MNLIPHIFTNGEGRDKGLKDEKNLKNRVLSSDHLLFTGSQADCHFKNSTKVIELNTVYLQLQN